MKRRFATAIVFGCIAFAPACGASPNIPSPITTNTGTQVIIQGTSAREEVQSYEIDNCNGKADFKRTETRTKSIETTISSELAAKVGASIEVINAEVQATVGIANSSSNSKTTTAELVAPPKTRMLFQITWIGEEQIGLVQNLRGSNTPIVYRYFVPRDYKIKSIQDIGCPGQGDSRTPVIVGAPSQAKPTSPSSQSPQSSQGLSSCGEFVKGETRSVKGSTFVIGDVYVNGVKEFDDGDGEGTVVYFEVDGQILAPYGAGCYSGTFSNLESIVNQQFINGCGSGCQTVRIVIVKQSGIQPLQFRKK